MNPQNPTPEQVPSSHAPPAQRASRGKKNAKKSSIRDLLAVNFGNSLEWYDWNIYTIFAPYFVVQFFNPNDGTSAFLSTLAVFAVGFIARPLGGFLFGAFADRVGRKQSLFWAMSLTALGSLIIAVAPSFETVGIWASVILVTARLLQGLAHGGEMGTSVTYLVERAPKGMRARFGSTSWVSVVIGTMLASLTGLLLETILSESQIADWGWRIAFGLGGLLGLYALYLRRKLEETSSFEASKSKLEAQTPDSSKKKSSSIFHHWKGLLIIFGVSAGGSLMFYTWLIYLPTYAQQNLGLNASSALGASLIAQFVFIFMILAAGFVGDKLGRKPLVIAFGLFFAIGSIPLFNWVNATFASVLIIILVALFGVAMLFGVNGAVWSEALPTEHRASGVAGTLSLATALFGGTAPYLIAWASERGDTQIFLWYMVAVSVITLLTGLLMPETKDKILEPSTKHE